MNEVKIIASGSVGTGKSALLGEIEIMLRAMGIPVRYEDEEKARIEKNGTHADWTEELERTQPTVVLVEDMPWLRAAAPQVVADEQIAGALFDLMGFLTTSETRYKFSAYDEASPAVEALQEFAKKRGLNLSEADVAGWRNGRSAAAPAPTYRNDPTVQGMADCMDMVRQELIEAGVIGAGVAPMFIANAVVAKLAAPVHPVAVPDGLSKEFDAKRLRRTASLLGLAKSIPDKDEDLMGCLGAVLGMICREVERLAAPSSPATVTDTGAQGDGKDAERLDWLVSQHGSGYQIGGTKGMGWFYVSPSSGSCTKLFDTAREAIDAAIAAKAGS